MVTDRQSFNPSASLYEDGKIGSVRDFASLSEKRRGEEISRECIPADISLEKDTSRPVTR